MGGGGGGGGCTGFPAGFVWAVSFVAVSQATSGSMHEPRNMQNVYGMLGTYHSRH